MTVITSSVEETKKVGAQVAAAAKPGDVYALEGDLGTGKTEFVRGFVWAIDPGTIVRSPSFSVVNIYETPRLTIYHFDFYRLSEECELREIGFDEYVNGDGVCLIEWGTMFPSALPPRTRLIAFRDRGPSTREIVFDPER